MSNKEQSLSSDSISEESEAGPRPAQNRDEEQSIDYSISGSSCSDGKEDEDKSKKIEDGSKQTEVSA